MGLDRLLNVLQASPFTNERIENGLFHFERHIMEHYHEGEQILSAVVGREDCELEESEEVVLHSLKLLAEVIANRGTEGAI